MRSFILGIYPPVSELNGQFGKLTDHTGEEPRSLSLPERPFAKQYIYTVAHASGSERYVFLPWLLLLSV